MSKVPVLEVRDLFKKFPKVQAVNGMSFSIQEGVCFGLLGPNGAGKTTTIEMAEGITLPDRGEVLYRGQSIGKDLKSIYKEKIGIQFQKTALPDFLTVREVLELFSSFYHETVKMDDLVQMCGLEEFWNRDHGKLSGGQKQRLLLAMALLNNPDVLFLDEPTTGLDPQARRNFWELVQKIKAQKKTVVLTTHYMEEAYVLCDEIAIVDHGKVIAQGVPKELLQKHFNHVAIELPVGDVQALPHHVPWPTQTKDGIFEIQTPSVNDTLQFLIAAKIDLSRMSVRSHNLEDLFLNLTGKAERL